MGPGMLSGSNTVSKVEAKASIYMKLSFITLAKTSQIPKFAFLRCKKVACEVTGGKKKKKSG